MRVMSFNLRFDNPRDGENRWEQRTAAVTEVWRAADAHVVGIQEGLIHQVLFLQAHFPEYDRVGGGRLGGAEGEHVCLFYDRRAFDCVEHGDFWLSDTPDAVGSKSWGNQVVRMATWAVLKDRDGVEWFILNTHLDHAVEVARVKGAELILEFLAGKVQNRPIVVTGDFNCGPDGASVEAFLRAGYADALAELGQTGITFHGFDGRSSSRIDYIFAGSRLGVMAGRVLDEKPGGRFPSDHSPIVAELVIRSAHGKA